MIITLIGASFAGEGKNIGTLSTWNISRVLGRGATYAGPNFVDKDAALSATVTLDEGCEIGSAGVTVTMGGSAVTSGVSTSGNVITISISKVTGNVVIKVPTKNTATGEEGGSDDIIPDEPSTGIILTLANYPTTKGVATSGTGVWSTTTTALLRRTAFVPVEGYSQIKLTHNASKYKYNLVFYNYNYTSSSQLSGGSSSGKADAYISDLNGWQTTSPFTHTLPSGTKSIAIGVSTASGTTLNTAATLADEFTSINLIDAQGNKAPVNLSDYSTHIGICATGNGIWSDTTDAAKLRKSAFVNVEGYTQVEFIFDDSAYKLNVVSYSDNITQPSDITVTSSIPTAKNAYISDLGGWQETSPFTKEIPADAKCVLIGVAMVDGTENTASTLADEFTSIELL